MGKQICSLTSIASGHAISYAINPGHHLNLQGASIKIRGQAIGVGGVHLYGPPIEHTCIYLSCEVSVGANPRAKT